RSSDGRKRETWVRHAAPVRVLFLTHRLPYAPDRGDRLRSYHILRHLSRRMHVDLVSLVHSDEERRRAAQMADRGFSVSVCETSRFHSARRSLEAMLSGQPLTHALLDSPRMRRALEAVLSRNTPDVV